MKKAVVEVKLGTFWVWEYKPFATLHQSMVGFDPKGISSWIAMESKVDNKVKFGVGKEIY